MLLDVQLGTHELMPPYKILRVASFIRDPGLLTSALGFRVPP